MSVLPIFIPCSESAQALELRNYLAQLKVQNLPQDKFSQDDWHQPFIRLLPCLGELFDREDLPSEELTTLMLTVATMILQLPMTDDMLGKAIDCFSKLFVVAPEKTPEKFAQNLFSLEILFKGLTASHEKYVIFQTMLECARKIGCVANIVTDHDEVSKILRECNSTEEEERALWKKLHDIHQEMGDSRKAYDALVRLLLTYTEANAAKGRSDAVKCILSVVRNPNIIAYDQLLTLKPVQFLEGEPIHNLLQEFISGNIQSFQNFARQNQKLFSENSLQEKELLYKIKILTFMQMARGKTELDYDSVRENLEIGSDPEVQDFIISVVRMKCVACKIDALKRRIIIIGTLPRAFGPNEWKDLLANLLEWKKGLEHVYSELQQMVGPEAAQ